jgi:hypothetical protein
MRTRETTAHPTCLAGACRCLGRCRKGATVQGNPGCRDGPAHRGTHRRTATRHRHSSQDAAGAQISALPVDSGASATARQGRRLRKRADGEGERRNWGDGCGGGVLRRTNSGSTRRRWGGRIRSRQAIHSRAAVPKQEYRVAWRAVASNRVQSREPAGWRERQARAGRRASLPAGGSHHNQPAPFQAQTEPRPGRREPFLFGTDAAVGKPARTSPCPR